MVYISLSTDYTETVFLSVKSHTQQHHIHTHTVYIGKVKRGTGNVPKKQPDTKIAYVNLVSIPCTVLPLHLYIMLYVMMQEDGESFEFPDLFGKYNRDDYL